MSKLPGQSRHSLPDRFRQSRAKSGHSGETFARASRAVLLSDAVTTRLPSGLNAMLRTSPHPRGAHVVSISSILALACGHQHTADLLVTDGKDCAATPGCEGGVPPRTMYLETGQPQTPASAVRHGAISSKLSAVWRPGRSPPARSRGCRCSAFSTLHLPTLSDT